MFKLKPDPSVVTALSRAALSCDCEGRPLQALSANALLATKVVISANNNLDVFFMIVPCKIYYNLMK